MSDIKRIFLIVLDSCGIGNAPDAENFGDYGANTIKSISKPKEFNIKNLLSIGFSDIDGLYDADPKTHPDAKLLHHVEELTPEIYEMAGGAGSWRGTGGMATKLSAARIATEAGCDMVITNGERMEDLYGIVAGEDIGTRFIAAKQ